ncbi:hypothetical protein BLX87_01475 [Bacillus sp. VT-16-64]|nr:hypothetical protein BLX87_01475 [Bacillus sp. VT-16-64]
MSKLDNNKLFFDMGSFDCFTAIGLPVCLFMKFQSGNDKVDGEFFRFHIVKERKAHIDNSLGKRKQCQLKRHALQASFTDSVRE